MILVFTPHNVASRNIAGELIEKHGFAKTQENVWERDGIRLINTNAPSVIEVPTDFDTDCIVVLSTHKSRKQEKVLTAHVPGNWSDAGLGGEPKTLNIAHASRLKIFLQEIKKEGDRIGWKTSLEVDHHGPTCNVPIIFVEIGTSEEEWNDEKAVSAMANAVSSAIKREGKFEAFLGFGGGHYAKDFTRIVLETELAAGHMAPKYAIDGLDEEMFVQGLEKTVEKVSKVLILKKETNSSQKKKIIAFAEKHNVAYELV